jgi:hypothetical protein
MVAVPCRTAVRTELAGRMSACVAQIAASKSPRTVLGIVILLALRPSLEVESAHKSRSMDSAIGVPMSLCPYIRGPTTQVPTHHTLKDVAWSEVQVGGVDGRGPALPFTELIKSELN